MDRNLKDVIISRREGLTDGLGELRGEREAEGGCGVIGLASTRPVAGRHVIRSVSQMRNRGNGKGGGLALVGCFPDYPHHYALNVGYLDLSSRSAVEEAHVWPCFDVAHVEEQPTIEDYRDVGLDIRPPDVVRYFVRVKPDVLDRFAVEHDFADDGAAEDEFVYQSSFRLNRHFYAEAEEKQAFVLSHGRDMMILKAVGYAEDIARYYRLGEAQAHVWIGHQRYPTRGRVWHPGGAHPYVGMDEALVHNGDFANYYAVTEYLKQRGYYPLFLTDTEVSVLLFDLYHRVYGYPLEYVIEAIAPTTERDFALLPADKQRVYRAIQRAHLHGSPDGPWFFILARSMPRDGAMQLIGITDTSMLRPQVFALQENRTQDPSGEGVSLGLIASEKQAIDAALQSLAREDPAVCPVADKYWNARGGSHSDGGAFTFTLAREGNRARGQEGGARPDRYVLTCADKFGGVIRGTPDQESYNPLCGRAASGVGAGASTADVDAHLARGDGEGLYRTVVGEDPTSPDSPCARWGFAEFHRWCEQVASAGAGGPEQRHAALRVLTLLHDRRYNTGDKKRAGMLAILQEALNELFRSVPSAADGGADPDRRIDWRSRDQLEPPRDEGTLFLDAAAFLVEGEDSAARWLVRAYRAGWRRFVIFACRGQRFIGCGLGPDTHGVRIDVYGSSGDYLGSGLDGAEIHVHGDAQDQVGQILKDGKLVIHGSVGQTFLYGAKGGLAYVLGNAAGRPLINAVGGIRAVINGTCLDYAAESFMAGPKTGGGFVLINGVRFDRCGRVVRLQERYPGSNFFSLASGGAGYVNDPERSLDDGQLNGARFTPFTAEDWQVLMPHLEENAASFGLPVPRLLRINGRVAEPEEVFRKVVAAPRELVTEGARS